MKISHDLIFLACDGFMADKSGARNPDRTDDLLITNQLLCQLSYAGLGEAILSDRLCLLKRSHPAP